jgi:HEAT repeat protein
VPAEVFSGLTGAIRDDNPRVRLEALHTFGLLAPLRSPDSTSAIRSGISWIIEALRRGDRVTQLTAAAAAGRTMNDCGDEPSAEPSAEVCAEIGDVLIESINSRDPQLRRAAFHALGELRYVYAAQALADQLSYYQRGADARAALAGLSAIGHPTSAEIFKRHLESGDAEMRRSAVEGLARAGASDSLDELGRMAENERSSAVLLALHFAMIRQGSPASIDQLVAGLGSSTLRSQALGYLLELSPTIGRSLAEFLGHEDAEVRQLLADILGYSADTGVVAALEAAAKDPDAEAALAARRAIDRLSLVQPSQPERSR